MGCCVSSHGNGSVPSAYAFQKQSKSPAKLGRAPPPPAMEVETVKEVLSETPTPKPSIHLAAPSTCQLQNPEPLKKTPPPPATAAFLEPLPLSQKADRVVEKGMDFPELRAEERTPKKKQNQAEEISEEASDICSLSESVSVSTATNLTDDSGVHHHLGHRGAHRSPAKIQPSSRAFRSFSGEISARRADQTAESQYRRPEQSQYRRPEQSPRRRSSGPVRPAHGGGEPVRARSVPRRRERDPGESSARRSRSPAMTRFENHGPRGARSGVGRSPSSRRTNPSPGRVRGDPNASRCRESRDLDNINGHQEGDKRTNGDDSVSLENPQVSLECFIFL